MAVLRSMAPVTPELAATACWWDLSFSRTSRTFGIPESSVDIGLVLPPPRCWLCRSCSWLSVRRRFSRCSVLPPADPSQVWLFALEILPPPPIAPPREVAQVDRDVRHAAGPQLPLASATWASPSPRSSSGLLVLRGHREDGTRRVDRRRDVAPAVRGPRTISSSSCRTPTGTSDGRRTGEACAQGRYHLYDTYSRCLLVLCNHWES